MTNSKARPQPPVDNSRWLAFGLITVILLISGVMWYTAGLVVEDTTKVVIPKNDWLAYHYIPSTDLSEAKWPKVEVAASAITNTTTISGFISLTPLTANQPFTVGQVIPVTDETLIVDKVVIAIEGSPALAFGGKLEPGNVVSAWIGENQILDRVLILDVQSYEIGELLDKSKRYVITLAISPDFQDELISTANHGSLVFSFEP